MARSISLYLMILFVCSCTEYDSRKMLTEIKLNPNKENEIIFSDIIDSLYLVPLETTEQVLLADISKLEFDDGHYFINNTQDYLVYVFNEKGFFEYQLAKKGNGPGEIQYPQCFALDKIKKEVLLTNNNAFYRYDYKGKYLGALPYSLSFSDFCVEKNGNLYFYTNKTNNSHIGDGFLTGNITMINSNGKKTWFKSEAALRVKPNESTMSFTTSIPFSLQNDGSIICHYVFSDTIYSIVREHIDPIYVVDLGGNKSKIDLDQIPGRDVDAYVKARPGTVWCMNSVIGVDDFLTFRYLFDYLEEGTVFFNKKNNHIMDGVFINDLLKGRIRMLGNINNKFVGYLPAYDIEVSDKIINFISEDKLREIAKITSDNNPVLIEFTLKEF